MTLDEAQKLIEEDLQRREAEAVRELNEWAAKHKAKLYVQIGDQMIQVPVIVRLEN